MILLLVLCDVLDCMIWLKWHLKYLFPGKTCTFYQLVWLYNIKGFFFSLGEDFCQNWLSAIASFWNLKILYPLLRGLRLRLSTLVSFKLYFHCMHSFFSYKGLFISFSSKCCIYFWIKTNYTIKHRFNSGILNPLTFFV